MCLLDGARVKSLINLLLLGILPPDKKKYNNWTSSLVVELTISRSYFFKRKNSTRFDRDGLPMQRHNIFPPQPLLVPNFSVVYIFDSTTQVCVSKRMLAILVN
jgi:hypothetical protein